MTKRQGPETSINQKRTLTSRDPKWGQREPRKQKNRPPPSMWPSTGAKGWQQEAEETVVLPHLSPAELRVTVSVHTKDISTMGACAQREKVWG